jgi:hypothetical protein
VYCFAHKIKTHETDSRHRNIGSHLRQNSSALKRFGTNIALLFEQESKICIEQGE